MGRAIAHARLACQVRRRPTSQATGARIRTSPTHSAAFGWTSHTAKSNPSAKITCVNPKILPASFAGREFDEKLLSDLPAGVDPCGENGEFHTFVYDGPMFRRPIPVCTGEVVERDGFVFADLDVMMDRPGGLSHTPASD